MKDANNFNKLAALLALAVLPGWAIAAGDHGATMSEGAAASGHKMMNMDKESHMSDAGKAGDAAKVSRTIQVELNDTMRFTPDNLTAKAGETVRFFVVNKGKLTHEMIVGTAEEIDEHAQMMKKMPGMMHKEANQINLAPGQRGAIVWQFAKAGTVTYACLVPGHKEAGMVGKIEVN
ncbi:MAG: cupredoxin family protein [Burkholderiaceae bacterium]